ncbi:MAG TPA: hypothetical protein ENI80_11515 [Acidiferrobacteraceae bacterium]|nr:hypothetical protein [Acidiferrobacteraceae bacterium]
MAVKGIRLAEEEQKIGALEAPGQASSGGHPDPCMDEHRNEPVIHWAEHRSRMAGEQRDSRLGLVKQADRKITGRKYALKTIPAPSGTPSIIHIKIRLYRHSVIRIIGAGY